MKIPVQQVESIGGDVEAMRRQIAARAEELHHKRGETPPLDDWLAAEQEVIWRPALEVQEHDDTYVVAAAVAGLEPGQIRVRMAATDVLIEADVHHRHLHTGDALLCEFSPGPLFRSYHFARPVDSAHASAQYRNGMLRITAPLAPARVA